MANQMIPIGKLFDVEKGELQSTKCTPGEFDFITAAEDWKTHTEYSHECEALIFAAAASGSLGRTHYVDGKFTTSDLCYILKPKDEEKYPLNLSFYHFVFNSLRPTLVAATKSGTSKESINQTNFKNYEIPYFDIELQDFWIEKLKNTLGLKDFLVGELTHQETLLKKLRQQILQEAIEGKLTADWRTQNPDVEPASELLKRIAAEKAQLVKDKKIKAQKPLPPITDKEKPFKLPQGWEWCRLGEIADAQDPNPSHRMPSREVNGVPFISPVNVDDKGNINFETGKRVSMSVLEDQKSRYTVMPHSFAFSRIGTIGDVFKLPLPHNYCLSYSLSVITPVLPIMEDFLMRAISSNVVLKQAIHGTTKNTIPDLGMQTIRSFVLPLPSLDEQKVIFQKIEYLMTVCDKLATLIARNKVQAEQLMQAVLKEAFNHNREAETAASLSKIGVHLPEVIRA